MIRNKDIMIESFTSLLTQDMNRTPINEEAILATAEMLRIEKRRFEARALIQAYTLRTFA